VLSIEIGAFYVWFQQKTGEEGVGESISYIRGYLIIETITEVAEKLKSKLLWLRSQGYVKIDLCVHRAFR
jgi:transcriptional regulatory protein LevR